jgi:serine protease Do
MYSAFNTPHDTRSRNPAVSFFAGLSMLIVLSVLMTGKAMAFALPDFETLVKQHGKAVVKISVTGQQRLTNAPQFDPELMPEPFRRFFEENPGQFNSPDNRRSSGFGSGFILSEDGYIVTNAHVVDNASEITVALPDRRQYTAELVGADPRTDLAVLKINASDLPTLELGDSDALNVGQWVLAIGTPFGFDYTATQGIVSALSRSLPNENYVPFIQTDVAVNPGNSGGPLFNTEGKVIGVNSQIFSRSGGYMGLSFAIPSNVVKTVVAQLKDNGYVSRGWLGVLIQNVDKSLAESFGMDRPEGALVSRVTADSPADEAGLKTGDVIVEFNGQKIGQSSNLPPIVGAVPVGSTVDVKVMRGGKMQTLPVTIAELAEDRQVSLTRNKTTDDESRLGIAVAPMTEEQRESIDVENGVVVQSVDPQGVAALAGIVSGDVIVSFNQSDVDSVDTLASLVREAPAGESIAVLIHRNDNPLFTALTLPE